MAEHHRVKLLIIGAGAAGYTAAIYAARAGLEPVVIQGLQPGGQMTITTDVENYPGFADVIQGPWLMEQMGKQAESVGAKMVFDLIESVDFTGRPLVCRADSGDVYEADSVIIATGASARWLGLESEQRYNGRGVSACATCDGFFYKNRHVAVVGGGNTAVEEALYLANICESVTLIHRRDTLRAERIMQERLFAHPKISVIWDHVVDEVLGDAAAGVTGLRLRHSGDGSTRELPVDGLFVAIGHDPATAPFKGQVRMDDEGYLVTAPDSTATDVPGVFAAGDVKDKVFRQAVTAAGMGCMAALEAERYMGGLAQAETAGAGDRAMAAAGD
ncbi:MAG: thioredoxin-disulfide reductase [Azospirillaceae bacterium]